MTRLRAQGDGLIVPSTRVGPVALGMAAADVFHVIGDPTYTFPESRESGVALYNWSNDLTIYVKKDSSDVTQICALNPRFATAQGIHPGLTDAAVTEALGEPRHSKVYRVWWRRSYVHLFWPGLMVIAPLTGFERNHVAAAVCVNHLQ